MTPTVLIVSACGNGVMGNGIAHVSALAGLNVRLLDVSDERIKAGLDTIKKNLTRQSERGKISADDAAQALKRIKTGVDYKLFGDCDMVIEAATENEQIKREIFKTLLPSLKADAILCTNTSSISITRLAAVTDRPGRFMGMHFMNPVPVMELVELIRGIATEEQTFQAV